MKILSESEISEASLRITPQGIFNDIDEHELTVLARYGEWVQVKNEMIVHDGAAQEYLFLLGGGTVEIHKTKDKSGNETKKQVFAKMTGGDCFGEMALLSGGNATANVEAVGEVIFWRIRHTDLLSFAAEYVGGKQLILNVASILSARLVEGNQKIIALANEFSDFLNKQAKAGAKDAGSKQSIEAIEKRLSEIQQSYTASAKEVKKSRPLWIFFTITTLMVLSLLANVWFFQNQQSFANIEKKNEEQIAELKTDNRDLRANKDRLLNSYTQLMENVQSSLKSILQISASQSNNNSSDEIEENPALTKLMSRLDETQAMIESNRELERKIAELQQQNQQLLAQSQSSSSGDLEQVTVPSKNRYALMKKVVVRGPRVPHPVEKDSSGKPLLVKAGDRYFFVCLSEATRLEEVYEVSPKEYNGNRNGKLFLSNEIKDWVTFAKLPTEDDIREQFIKELAESSKSKMETEESDEPIDSNNRNSVDAIFNQLTKGIQSGI
jgi:CRP-like cAMP-binding protein